MKITVVGLALVCALLCSAVSYGASLPTLPAQPKISWTPIAAPKITPIPYPKITPHPIPTGGMPCPVIISEVMVNSSDNGEHVGEYIELFNNSMFDVDISDWSVADEVGWGTIIDFTRFGDLGVRGTSIPPFGYALIMSPNYNGMYSPTIQNDPDVELDTVIMVTVHNSDGSGEIGNGLANDGDSISITTDYLNDNGSSVVLHVRWGNQGQDGSSYQLCGNGWFTRQPTPGGPNWCGI